MSRRRANEVERFRRRSKGVERNRMKAKGKKEQEESKGRKE